MMRDAPIAPSKVPASTLTPSPERLLRARGTSPISPDGTGTEESARAAPSPRPPAWCSCRNGAGPSTRKDRCVDGARHRRGPQLLDPTSFRVCLSVHACCMASARQRRLRGGAGARSHRAGRLLLSGDLTARNIRLWETRDQHAPARRPCGALSRPRLAAKRQRLQMSCDQHNASTTRIVLEVQQKTSALHVRRLAMAAGPRA